MVKSEKISEFSARHKSLLASILVAALMVDTMLSNISDITNKILGSIGGVALFGAIVVMIYASSYLLFIGYSRQVGLKILLKSKDLHYLYKSMVIILHVLLVLSIAISFQLILFSEYDSFLLVIITLVGYLGASILLSLMTYHMYQWYKRNIRNVMLLLFVISSAVTAATCLSSGLSQGGLMLQTDFARVSDNTGVVYPSLSSSTAQLFADIYSLSLILGMLSYGLTWVAVSLLLHSYSRRIGLARYLLVISLPMGAFLLGIAPILFNLPTASTYFDPNLLLFRIISISALLSVGVLFGASFLTTVRVMKQHTYGAIVDYLFISAFGISSLFVSLAANIAFGAFPPFGISTYGFVTIASYFFFIGIYSSAIKVSSDIELRRTIRKSISEQSRFLNEIGSAQIEQKLETHALKLQKEQSEQLASVAGIQSEVSTNELKDYVRIAIEEMDKAKRKGIK